MGSSSRSVLLCILIINYYNYNLCLRVETRRKVKFSLKSSGPAAFAPALKARRSQFPYLKLQIPGISRICAGQQKGAGGASNCAS